MGVCFLKGAMPAKSHGHLFECVRNFLKLRNFWVLVKMR